MFLQITMNNNIDNNNNIIIIIIKNPKLASLVAVVAQTEQMKTVTDIMWTKKNYTTIVIYQWAIEINNASRKKRKN